MKLACKGIFIKINMLHNLDEVDKLEDVDTEDDVEVETVEE